MTENVSKFEEQVLLQTVKKSRKGKLATQTQINFRMTRNQELDLLQSAELKQAFDEFDKVENMMGYTPISIECCSDIDKGEVHFIV